MARRVQAEGQESLFGDAPRPSRRPPAAPAAPEASPPGAPAPMVRQRVPYDKRPGTRLPKEARSNVWIEIQGKYLPRANFDTKSGLYQRASYSTHLFMESLTFYPVEVRKMGTLPVRSVEHIDLDHFSRGQALLEEMRCYRVPFPRFRVVGHWAGTPRGERWVVPLWAWDILGYENKTIQVGTDIKPEDR